MHTPDHNVLHSSEFTRSDIALRQLLLTELETMEFNEACFVRSQDMTCLHDFRVALRRTRVLLLQTHGVFTAGDTRRYAAALARLGQLTGACRDLDVVVEQWPDYVNESAGLNPCIYPVLQQQRDATRAHLVAELNGKKHQLFILRWREFLCAHDAVTRMPQAIIPVSLLARDAIERIARKVFKKLKSINQDSSDRKLHKLRIACKRLRYLLECFKVFEKNHRYRMLIAELKNMQENLGDYQDLIVQRSVMLSLLQKISATEQSVGDVADVERSIKRVIKRRTSKQREFVMESVRKFLRSDALAHALNVDE